MGKFAKTALKKGVVVNTMSGETKHFPVGTTVEDIRNTLYPGTRFYRHPKLVFVDSLQNGYVEGVLPRGSYTLVQIARKPLPSPRK